MKKIIAMLLCLVMIVGLFGACSTSGNEGTKAPDGTEGTKDTEGTKATDGKDETTVAPGYDFPKSATDGVELGTLPLVPAGTKATLTIGLAQHINTPDYDTNLQTLYFEEKTGIDLEFKLYASTKADYVAELNAQIAANQPLPDILLYMNIGADMVSELGNDGYLIDMTPYLEEQTYFFNLAYDKAVEKAGADSVEFDVITAGKDAISGEYYGYPTKGFKGSADPYLHIGINQAWLNTLKLKTPTTVDELYNVLVAFRDQDPNGNGLKDEIPMICNATGYRADVFLFIINAFVYCQDAQFFNITDGKVWVPYNTEEYRQALKYLNKLYEEKLISESCWGIDNTEMKGLVSGVNGTSTVGVYGGHSAHVWDTTCESLLDYQHLETLKDKTGKGGYAPDYNSVAGFHTYITTDCKDPVLAFRFLDYLSQDEAQIIQGNGMIDVNWRYLEPGKFSVYGEPATIDWFNSEQSVVSNNLWHNSTVGLNPGANVTPYDPTTQSPVLAFRTETNAVICKQNMGNQPAEVARKLLYNAEEQEVYNEYFTIVKDTMTQWRAEFITGVKDIDSDADWKAYVDALESDGLKDLIAVAQSCYTRMMGSFFQST